MSISLSELEAHRNGLLQQFTALGDMRRGSVSVFRRRRGRPNCHCARPKDPGHGPPYRLTQSVNGKTVTETFTNETQRRKAQREMAEFHHFQQLGRELLAISEKICRLRPVGEEDHPPWEKRPKRSTRKSPKK